MEGTKILLVDDSATVINVLSAAFEEEGYSVVTAMSGEEGIKQASLTGPDVVIIDTILPDIDGFEVCLGIRKIDMAVPPKIIMITGNVDAVDAVKAKQSGADDYVVKTSDFQLLMDAVRNLAG
jgi:DNA-binding response OmpR family regulator